MSSNFVFYGFSGDPGKPAPSFPDGADRDKRWQLVADTLNVSIKKLFPADSNAVQQAWTKDKILQALENAVEPIRQVHIVCHGDTTWLSLAYHYDHLSRLTARAKKFNAESGTADERAIRAMREEDALVAGFFTRALEPSRLANIKSNHMPDASWQIWACYSGWASDAFEGIGDPEIDPYLLRFNFGQTAVPGVAVDIAKGLGVTCTAALEGWGLSTWHGTPAKVVKRNDKNTPANQPQWLWNTNGSRWVSYGPTGTVIPKPMMFGQPRDKKDLPAPKPPKWLTDLYWK